MPGLSCAPESLNWGWSDAPDTIVIRTQAIASGDRAIRCTRPGFDALMQAHAIARLQLAAQQPVLAVSDCTPLALIAPEFDAMHYLANREHAVP